MCLGNGGSLDIGRSLTLNRLGRNYCSKLTLPFRRKFILYFSYTIAIASKSPCGILNNLAMTDDAVEA